MSERVDSVAHDADRPSTGAGLLHARHWLVLASTLCAFALGMWRLDAKSIWWDESLSLYRAQRDIFYILSNRIDFPGASTIDLHPPLYFLVLHGAVRLAGESDLVLRFPSVGFAALLVPLSYAMGKRLRSARVGVVSAVLAAISPFYLWYAQEARMYTMVAALGLLSFYCLWRALTERRGRWWIGWGVAVSAAVATQYLALLLVLCELGLALWLWQRKPALAGPIGAPYRLRHHRIAVALGVLFLLLVMAIVGSEALRMAVRPQQGREYVSLGIMLRDAYNSFSLGLSVDISEVWALDLLFLATFLFGVVSLWRTPPRLGSRDSASTAADRRGAGLIAIVGYILVPIVLIWVYSLFNPIYMGSRYVMMCSPAFYLGMALGLDALAGSKRILGAILGLALLLGMGYSVWRYFCHERYRTKEDYRSAAQHVMANERVKDVIVVTAPENITAFLHYYQGALPVLVRPSIALSGHSDAELIDREMSELLPRYDRVWFVHARTMFSDPDDLVARWLGTRRLLLERTKFPSYGSPVTLSAYSLRPLVLTDVPATSPPFGTFGGRLAVSGYTVRHFGLNGQARELPASALGHLASSSQGNGELIPSGKVLSVVFRWRPLEQLRDLKVSMRLVDPSGEIRAQRDRMPYLYWPTSKWPLAATIRHEADLPIPADIEPGIYVLQLWVYDAESGQAWPFNDGASADLPCAELGTLTVQ